MTPPPTPDPAERDAESRQVVILETTFPSRSEAEACAARLVEQRCAACVQVEGPVDSTYRWQGAVHRTAEWRCRCKTSPAAAADCRRAVEQAHPYETPEVLIARVESSPAYAAWVRENVVAGTARSTGAG